MGKITFPGGNTGGGGGGVSDHGGLAGLADDDHTQYLLREDFAASGATISVDLTNVATNITPDTSGSHSLGVASKPFASGIFDDGFWIRGQDDGQSPGFDRNGWNIRTIAMNGSLTNLESNSVQLNTTGSLLWGSQASITSPADSEFLFTNNAGTVSGVLKAGSGIFNDQVTISGVNVGDFLSAGGGAADLSAVAEPILPDTSGIRDVGSFAKVWASGFFDGIVLADSDSANTYWKLTVGSGGTLTTTQVT